MTTPGVHRGVLALLLAAAFAAPACAAKRRAALASEPISFDECLVAHMVAAHVLEGTPGDTSDAEGLLEAVRASQAAMLDDPRLDADELAQRTSGLMRMYSGAADAAVAEAEARGASARALAERALGCAEAF